MSVAVIGGTGIDQLAGLSATREQQLETPFGAPSGAIEVGAIDGVPVLFLQRHGKPRSLPPHRINYRANLWALRELGAAAVVAINAVGGIHEACEPGTLVVPDQLIDYTWGREHTVDEGGAVPIRHVDFTEPYDPALRRALLMAAQESAIACRDGGVLGVTQGPRLETAAEIQRLRRDGCDLVGMTGMPEAALARELGLPYASLCMVVNAAPGLDNEPLTLEAMGDVLAREAGSAAALLRAFLTARRRV
ncbi:S-methyl-5'-thioinosine phosphorylase [Pseudohaliea rubra]|uniref:Probable 6-oxopurine nucleoside phosphorylase n=1 Tax=Pseudohaliea rubra DSM 19751 TaxID=1265313 RepID=A0A095VPH5_9GAMM|nr:S-methyl-5'-thioinosine phosphorylase [Pseudohaliea rubra]KGE03372.1 5'-methylthioadenosine phosphorylase [Pseudohaliea rubra DSM 19751]